jgi:hypothetical protein
MGVGMLRRGGSCLYIRVPYWRQGLSRGVPNRIPPQYVSMSRILIGLKGFLRSFILWMFSVPFQRFYARAVTVGGCTVQIG